MLGPILLNPIQMRRRPQTKMVSGIIRRQEKSLRASLRLEDDVDPIAPASASTANGTPAKRGGNKRKSVGPEHKKKTPGKKRGPPELRLDVQPGEYWFVAMRGFPPWPVIICDEEMLPETLLSKRPVSAKRIDGTYREDFREGGKNAKDRRYPIMFLGTNEL